MIRLLKTNILLIIILLAYLITRLYQITGIPPSLYWDEASIGVNAHSIITSGKDEWGETFPVHFRAFGEFKLPVYIYAAAISESIVGFNELSVRLPSVLFGLGVILLTYLITFKLTNNKLVANLSSFLLTISPYFFIFSRTGYEAVAGLMFFELGIYLGLNAPKKPYMLILAAVAFIFSIYSHNSFRILVPPAILLLTIYAIKLNYSLLKRQLLFGAAALLIFFISLVPIIRLMIYDSSFGRINAVSVIPLVRWVTGPDGRAEFQLISAPGDSVSITQKFQTLAANYLSHFSPGFLIYTGDGNSRSQQPGFGQLYLPDLIFFAAGIIYIFKTKRKMLLLPLILLLTAPIPSALTTESPHALRTITIAPFLLMISSFGMGFVLTGLGKKGKVVLAGALIIYLVLFGLYFNNFLLNYSKEASRDWQYGYKEIFTKYSEKFPDFDKVVISNQYAQPYIYSLYYLKYPLDSFRREAVYESPDNWGFSTVKRTGKFYFQKINSTNLPEGKLLIFATPGEKLDNGDSPGALKIQKVGVIEELDGKVSFMIYAK